MKNYIYISEKFILAEIILGSTFLSPVFYRLHLNIKIIFILPVFSSKNLNSMKTRHKCVRKKGWKNVHIIIVFMRRLWRLPASPLTILLL